MRILNLSLLFFVILLFCFSCVKDAENSERQRTLLKDISRNLIAKNEAKVAIANLKEAEEKFKEDSEIYKLLGIAYYKADILNLAETSLLKSYELNKKDIDISIYLAQLYSDIGRWQEVILWANRALENILFPEPYVAYNLIGWAYYNTDELDSAVKFFKKAIIADGNFVPAQNNLAKSYFRLKKFKKSGELFVRLIVLCKNKCPETYLSEFYYRLALCFRNTQNKVKTLKYLKKASEVAPKSKFAEESEKLIRIIGTE